MRFHLENGRAMHAGKTHLRHCRVVHERPRGCVCAGTLVTAAGTWTRVCGVIRRREQPPGFPSAYELAWCPREGRRLCRVCGTGEIHGDYSSAFWEPHFQKDRLKLGKRGERD